MVSARSSTPGTAATRATSSGRCGRISGSPPVIRTRVTPSATNRSTRNSVSSKLSRSFRGSQTYSASGMQYWQRRLHRSVTDSRRLRSGRRNRSRAIRGGEAGSWVTGRRTA